MFSVCIQCCFTNTLSTYMKVGADSGLSGAPTPIITEAKVVCEGYVFTPVCHSVHILPQCMLGYTTTPWTDTHLKFKTFTSRIIFLRKLRNFVLQFCIVLMFSKFSERL